MEGEIEKRGGESGTKNRKRSNAINEGDNRLP